MTNQAIDATTVTSALAAALAADPKFKGCTILRGEPINSDPQNAAVGWIGLYRGELEYEPRTLGFAGRNFRATVRFSIVAQATAFDTAEQAEEALEKRVNDIINVLFTDLSVRSTLSTITGLNVRYAYVRTKETTAYFQEAYIEVTGVTETTGGN